MSYTLSTEELKQKFGEIILEIIYQKESTRISCVRKSSDNSVIAYSLVTFEDTSVQILNSDFHRHILSGKAIGETIKDFGIPHERTVSEPFLSKVNFGESFLFDTKKDFCVSRIVNYKINGAQYVSITEFYNPELIPIGKDLQERESIKGNFLIDRLKIGYEEDYLKLTHGFLKKTMHVGIEDQNVFLDETRATLASLMKDSNTKLFVAANDKEFIGYTAINIHPALHVNGLECVARELYVKDEYQRKGIGRALMAYIERYAKDLGCKRISLATKWDDEIQKAFYENMGFSRRCDFVIKKIS